MGYPGRLRSLAPSCHGKASEAGRQQEQGRRLGNRRGYCPIPGRQDDIVQPVVLVSDRIAVEEAKRRRGACSGEGRRELLPRQRRSPACIRRRQRQRAVDEEVHRARGVRTGKKIDHVADPEREIISGARS